MVLPRAGVFYNVKNGSSFITSKSSSENLSNHNKYLCFCCLQDKMWMKMPKWTVFLISSEKFVMITENFWRIFWHDNWRSIIGVVENFHFSCKVHIQRGPQNFVKSSPFFWLALHRTKVRWRFRKILRPSQINEL